MNIKPKTHAIILIIVVLIFFASWFTEKIIFDNYNSHREQFEKDTLKLESMEKAIPCICSSNSYNCDDFSNKVEAQECFEYCGINNDIHWLDEDNDGLACEWLN
ncbi:MAG: excalibur calcium-binding domain-containing protein [Armatimonadetes bacterium]|nr:excalibur calcium-binding domain-containing protein [Armatimonadota bacterium]